MTNASQTLNHDPRTARDPQEVIRALSAMLAAAREKRAQSIMTAHVARSTRTRCAAPAPATGTFR